MPSLYHVGTPGVNSTPVHVPNRSYAPPHTILTDLDIATVTRSLRRTLSKIHDLTHVYGFCFACVASIAEKSKQTPSSVRKHIARLIALNIVRREEVQGYADRLFICPMAAWENSPRGAQNGRTQHIVREKASSIETNKPARGRVASPASPGADPAPVVVLSAKASEDPDSRPHIGNPAPVLPMRTETVPALVGSSEPEEDALTIASLLSASISSAEDEIRALDGGADVMAPPRQVSIGANPTLTPAPCSGDTSEAPQRPAGRPNAMAPTIGASALPSEPLVPIPSGLQAPGDGANGLTPEQATILRQLCASEVAARQAQIMVRGDVRKAGAVLKALASAIQRGKGPDCPGGWCWSCWANPEWVAPVQRGSGAASPPCMASELGYRIADGPVASPTRQVDPSGQSVIATLRAKGFGTTLRD